MVESVCEGSAEHFVVNCRVSSANHRAGVKRRDRLPTHRVSPGLMQGAWRQYGSCYTVSTVAKRALLVAKPLLRASRPALNNESPVEKAARTKGPRFAGGAMARIAIRPSVAIIGATAGAGLITVLRLV